VRAGGQPGGGRWLGRDEVVVASDGSVKRQAPFSIRGSASGEKDL
jgi:hypothetical protein